MTVLVIGAAASGRAALWVLQDEGEKVVVFDHDPGAVAGIEAAVVCSGEWDSGILDGVNRVITSPGVSEHSAPVAAALAAGIPVWSELELGFRRAGLPVIAVTGTNGKTTVTEMATAMLQQSGIRATAAGNIGEPLSAIDPDAWDVLVVEASSFQLRFVETFHARVAVLLNLAPDHLDWHSSIERYVAAKQRILERQTAADIVVFDADDPGAVAAVAPAVATPVPVSGTRIPDGGWGVADGVWQVDGASVPVAELTRQDSPFLVDLAAAAAAARHFGARPEAIETAARHYRTGRHRREVVGVWDGITWVDDSKATNPHAAVAAIRAHRPVVLIAGGRSKGLDITPLVNEPGVRAIVAIGEASAAIAAAAPGTVLAGSIEEAVEAAAALARSGDTVLLAPGCASFDMFRSYSDRGERFAAAVRALRGG